MALTVSESIDLNTVLRFLLGLEASAEPSSADAARNAALRLAAKAHRTLSAGLMPHEIARAWPVPRPRRARKGAVK